MNNMLSYGGLVDEKIRASDKDLPLTIITRPPGSVVVSNHNLRKKICTKHD